MNAEILARRLSLFGKLCRQLATMLPTADFNRIYGRQLIRAASSPGANYIEALEAESKKDFIHRLKICRKETRESVYWLDHISDANPSKEELITQCAFLTSEGNELIRIFTASILTAEKRK